MKNYLIIDVSYLIYRAYFAYPELTAKVENEQVPIGAFFGFVKTILALCNYFEPNELIFACDTASPTWRHDAQTDYKAGRKPLEDAMRSQIPLIQSWCQSVSEHFLILEGLEADDLIASVAINLQSGADSDKLANFLDFRKIYSHDNSHQDFYNSQNATNNLNLEDINPQTNSSKQNLKNSDNNQEQNKVKNNLKSFLNSKQNNESYSSKSEFETKVETEKGTVIRIETESRTKIEIENFENNWTKESELKTKIQRKTDNKNKIMIFSKDRDLFQLLVFENVFFVDIDKGIPKNFGRVDFVKKYNLDPSQWLCYKTLVGDAGDNLPGIAGIGPKTATDILQIFVSVEFFLDYKIEDKTSIEKEFLKNLKSENKENSQSFLAENPTNQILQNHQNDLEKLTSNSLENLNSKISISQNQNFSKIEIHNKIHKLTKWQKLIEIEKINQIRRLSSLCWIDLDLNNSETLEENSENHKNENFNLAPKKVETRQNYSQNTQNFNLTNGIQVMQKYGFNSLITTLNNWQKKHEPSSTKKIDKNMDSLF